MATRETADLVDRTNYAGLETSGQYAQPFWDLPLYRLDEYGQIVEDDGPLYSDNEWDRVQLADYVLPGLWTATATPALQLDIQKPKGFDGAAVITRGYLPAGITLTGLIWTPLQWARMQEIIPAIWTRPHKVAAQEVMLAKRGGVKTVERDQGLIVGKQRSLTVINPALNSAGISSLVIKSLTPPAPHSTPQVKQMILQCIEYVPEPPGSKKPAVKRVEGQTSRGPNAFDKAIAAKDARNPKAPSRSREALEPGKLGE